MIPLDVVRNLRCARCKKRVDEVEWFNGWDENTTIRAYCHGEVEEAVITVNDWRRLYWGAGVMTVLEVFRPKLPAA